MGYLCNYTCKDCNVNLFHNSHHVFQKLYLFVSWLCWEREFSLLISVLQDVWGFLTFLLKALPNMRLFVEVTLGSNWRISMSGGSRWTTVVGSDFHGSELGRSVKKGWKKRFLGLILLWVWVGKNEFWVWFWRGSDFWWSVGWVIFWSGCLQWCINWACNV